METLVLIENPSVRDIVLVGLRNVPGIEAESPSGVPDVDRARRRAYDAIFIDHLPSRGGSTARLDRLRENAPNAEIVVVTEERAAKGLANERARLRLAATLALPVDVAEFFRLAIRLRKRAELALR